MLIEDQMSDDQQDAIDRLYQHNETLLIAQMGSGKTVVALTAMKELLESDTIRRFLIVSPLAVANEVWRVEHKKWAHLKDLRVVIATGTPAERIDAFKSDSQIVVINFENLAWVAKLGLLDSFGGLLVDESSKLKSGGSTFKALRKHIPNFVWRVAMSGTVISEGTPDLFYQMFLVDAGKRLGRNKDKFLRTYLYPTDHQNRKWVPLPHMIAPMMATIADVVYTVPDYRSELPVLHVEHIAVPLPVGAVRHYRDMAGSMEALGVVAETAAEQVQKLQQIASGFLYDGDKVFDIHRGKMATVNMALGELEDRASLVIVYQYMWERDEIEAILAKRGLRYGVLGGGVSTTETSDVLKWWNAGELDVLVIHPKSAGHGLNLEKGGHRMLWLAPPWSRDLWDQTIARLWRRGQTEEVHVDVLVATDTVDELIVKRLESKSSFMPAFLKHLESFK